MICADILSCNAESYIPCCYCTHVLRFVCIAAAGWIKHCLVIVMNVLVRWRMIFVAKMAFLCQALAECVTFHGMPSYMVKSAIN